jgi:hypothetical protein
MKNWIDELLIFTLVLIAFFSGGFLGWAWAALS